MSLFTITHRGVPIGTVELNVAEERAAAAVVTLPAYEAIRPIVVAAADALRAATIGATEGNEVSRGALQQGATLGRDLELIDRNGELVPTDFIELGEWPGEDPRVRAWIGFRGVAAHRVARRSPPKKRGPESAPPAA